MNIQPVVLCGGSGTRLWPLSREQHPKQLLALSGERSLLQETVSRMDGLAGKGVTPHGAIILCNEDYRFLVADQLREIGAAPRSILLEPAGKGTAPALTLAALHARSDTDPILVVVPSDHAIADREAFHDALRRGAALADAGNLVAFGVPPTAAETGYGYIRIGYELNGRELPAYDIRAFVEKPDAETARRYVDSGTVLWNSGIFMVRSSVWIENIGRFRPKILSACERAHGAGAWDGGFYRVDARAFAQCPEDTIDYAVMEQIGSRHGGKDAGPRAAAVRLEAGWSDVGAWDALWHIGARDAHGNVMRGDVLAVDTRNALLISQHRLLACVGLEDMVVVETPDAVMVARRDRCQEVRKIVSQLKDRARPECVTHRKVSRPWGSYDGVDWGERFQVKRLVVHPGAALSLQMHHHRAEHWIVVRGTARVTRGDEVFLLTENESTYIPLGTRHRLENPGRVPLEVIEVQSGGYLGEDDIVRFEDTYGRAAHAPATDNPRDANAPAAVCGGEATAGLGAGAP
jgi:mannose-1-phosphate guanylyltransferase / mannose-6-phosphate isomerase